MLTAAFGWLNQRFARLPHAIGLVVMGLASSLILIAAEATFPGLVLYRELTGLLHRLNFRAALLDGMLAFLLFAGALHVDLGALRDRAWEVGLMATLAVVISIALVGVGFWLAAGLLGPPIALAWALVFGALVSPPDPVAVLATLKAVRVPATLETDMGGESLFNDGAGVVVFTALLAVASGGGEVGAGRVAELFLVEALGGAALGLATGYLAYRAMRAIDDYPVEVLVSLALVAGTYALANRLHTSGPIAVVVAGLLVGDRGPRDAMSDQTKRYLFGFWRLVDEMLNAVLFLLIGLEVLVLGFDGASPVLAVAAVPLALVARLVAICVPVLGLAAAGQRFVRGTIPVLTWGGLRGVISVALTLPLPDVPGTAPILAATYTVVVFTIVAQGLSLRALVRRTVAG